MTPVSFHPLAELFPPIEGDEFEALVEDIRRHGLHEPVILYRNQILDGRNRYRASLEAGVQCRFEHYEGSDPAAYVVSLNLKRRHLNESQRAMVAAKLATLKPGDNQHSEGLPIGRGSELLNVGERTVARAREVQDRGAPELQRVVERGAISVSAAVDVATRPVEEQREIVARGKKGILEAAKQIRAQDAERRHAERIERHRAICEQNAKLPNGRRYPVIYADPPWRFKVYNEFSGIERAASNHYPTMEVEDICALPVSGLAAEAAVLLLWTTSPHLETAFQVIAAWGFVYKTNIVWVKESPGLGYIVRNQHELLLIATRGDIPSPAPSTRPASVIFADRREHSRKPDEAYELIERMWPELPKIELFARKAHDGWARWGNEA
jgi:N6-adenosine-specific RNA methylase IME4